MPVTLIIAEKCYKVWKKCYKAWKKSFLKGNNGCCGLFLNPRDAENPFCDLEQKWGRKILKYDERKIAKSLEKIKGDAKKRRHVTLKRKQGNQFRRRKDQFHGHSVKRQGTSQILNILRNPEIRAVFILHLGIPKIERFRLLLKLDLVCGK